MADRATHWVTLQFFHDGGVTLACNVKSQDGVHTGGTRECNAKITTSNRNGDGVHSMAVQNARNVVFCAKTTRCATTGGATYRERKRSGARHGLRV
jgi:hypothetical protein